MGLFSIGAPNSNLGEYEKNTWPELQRLASSVPESHIHFQDAYLYKRLKDAGTTVGDWFSESMKTDPWWQGYVPNVSNFLCAYIKHVWSPGSFTSSPLNDGLSNFHVLSSESSPEMNFPKASTQPPRLLLYASIQLYICHGLSVNAARTMCRFIVALSSTSQKLHHCISAGSLPTLLSTALDLHLSTWME